MALNAEHVQQLIVLQKHDQAIDVVDKALADIPAAIQVLKKTIEEARNKAASAKAQVQDFEKKKKERELELAQKEEAIRKHSGELNTVKTNEAFKALQTEIDRAKSEVGDIETAILELMEKIDAAQKELKKAAADFSAEEKVLLAQIAEKESSLAATQAKKETLLTERQALAAPIPEDIHKIYDHIRSRGKRDPISKAIKKSDGGAVCGACRMNLAPQMVIEVTKLKNFVFCESCQRILYIPEVLEKALKVGA
jgi:predicted  nucleic acid-binding Zn-ribbon protein